MKIEHRDINFEDARGAITDVFVGTPKEHCTIITTKKGGVRGNHYHQKSQQSDFVVSGSFKIYSQKALRYCMMSAKKKPPARNSPTRI